ncbi:GAF domain-containing protein [Dissulfurirhabdus thermomarina]|uniref:histidine kinase n=1 Tax=Dissulfurirhabdus thermomarina TaxID=1765737 RepID=A0A6N9TQV6_DISTH|nr:GAF domain-containing sensor histidine kinase [Dissulfurirhabdus thermomarina]NDY42114.1 GAF domain-containing protein [Dissulfurirhabdus thermomarina]NMX22864.1 GAF domain-containing protein [Dissulfurirhabdus thermomarina]
MSQRPSSREARLLRERLRELEALGAMGARIASSRGLEEVAEAALEAAARAAAPDLALFFVREDDRLRLLRTRPDAPEQAAQEPDLRLGECLCGLAAGDGPVFSGDIHADPRCTLEACKLAGYKAFVALPLTGRSACVGVLGLAWRRPRSFDESAPFYDILGRQAGFGLQNAQLVERLRHYAADLEAEVTRRTAEIRAANEDLEAFADSVSHDLRAPLRAIQGFARALADDQGPRLDATGRDYLDRILQASARMEGLIHGLLSYARLRRAKLPTGPVPLEAVVAEVLELAAPAARAGGGELTAEGSFPVVRGHRETLLLALSNLVDNALKFTAPGVAPRVRIRCDAAPDGRVRITVTDNGIGVPPEARDRIFRPFERLHGRETYPGTGIGLALVRRAAERMDGATGVAPAEGGGSAFWLEIPLAEG